jgi:hypothetical protein
VPTFCRHNRFIENCPICKAKEPAGGGGGGGRSGATRRTSGAAATRKPRSPRSSGDLRVRRVARAADDGYAHELVPGVRATADARRLAAELAFATARLALLESDPPGLFAEVAAAADPEEAAWLAFLIAYLSPLEAEDPFAGVRAARVPWATGEVPDLEGVELGPRTSHAPAQGARTLTAYRAWAARSGSQLAALSGDPSWAPQRRFDRAFERLALPGFGRAGRYELLVILGRTGVIAAEPGSLQLGHAGDATVLAAKRVFGIGDTINLQRRAADLAHETGVAMAALDLALVNWARPEDDRVTGGAPGAQADAAVAERVLRVLGAVEEEPEGEQDG